MQVEGEYLGDVDSKNQERQIKTKDGIKLTIRKQKVGVIRRRL